MAIPIAITGSYNLRDIVLTSSYARISDLRVETLDNTGTDFNGSYVVDVYYNSESFSNTITNSEEGSIGPIESKFFNYTFQFDEGDSDAITQVYNNLISSQSAFAGMTKKIYS